MIIDSLERFVAFCELTQSEDVVALYLPADDKIALTNEVMVQGSFTDPDGIRRITENSLVSGIALGALANPVNERIIIIETLDAEDYVGGYALVRKPLGDIGIADETQEKEDET